VTICKDCKEDKPLSEFFKRTDHNSYRKECKVCYNVRCSSYYSLETRHLKKKKLVEEMGLVCSYCKGLFPVAAYDFHHLDPSTKTRDPSKIIIGGQKGRDKLKEDCILLCANCHRIEHATYKLIPEDWKGTVK